MATKKHTLTQGVTTTVNGRVTELKPGDNITLDDARYAAYVAGNMVAAPAAAAPSAETED